MGYACPVCEAPQADDEHLAHHLALTAMLHGDDHEDWLVERVPDWSERDPSGLAAEVVGDAPEIDEEPVASDPGHDDLMLDGPEGGSQGLDELDAETRRAIEEARELTRSRRDEREEE